MLDLIQVTNDQGGKLSLPLYDMTSGYVVKSIDGLDPVKAVIVSTSFAKQDGEQYQASRRDKRNIIMKLGLEPDYSTGTVRNLRDQLYKILMPKSQVSMRFIDDDEAPVDIDGIVESLETPQFVQSPEATISVLCFDPDFRATSATVINGSTVTDSSESMVAYDGTVETGVVLHLQLNRDAPGFSFYNRTDDGVIHAMDITAPLKAGDIVEINSNFGSKGVSLNRGGSWSSLLYGLSPYSDWTQLFPGGNRLRVYVGGSGSMPYSLTYVTKYGGL